MVVGRGNSRVGSVFVGLGFVCTRVTGGRRKRVGFRSVRRTELQGCTVAAGLTGTIQEVVRVSLLLW